MLLAPKIIAGLRSTFFSWMLLCALVSVAVAVCVAKFMVLLEPVIAPVDCICVMLDVCALELAAAWPDLAAAAARSHCSLFSIRGGPTYRHAA